MAKECIEVLEIGKVKRNFIGKLLWQEANQTHPVIF
jgi:hypothetical protein